MKDRKRPRTTNTPHKRLARSAFGNAFKKVFDIPVCIDDYNYNMGAVDIADQLRAAYTWQFRWTRGPTPPLAWGFLLGTVLVNSYKLDAGYGTWRTKRRDHLEWRKALVQQLFQTFSPSLDFRHQARPGYFADSRNRHVPSHLHIKGKRGKRSVCVVCRARFLQAERAAKQVLQPLDANSTNVTNRRILQQSEAKKARKPGCRKETGCLTCDVALCLEELCWDMYHNSAAGVL